jgi:hypothetical protein
MSEFPRFEEGTTVRLFNIHDAVAIVNTDDGDQLEVPVDIEDENATYEIVSTDYEGGFLYHLRYEGEIDEYDYIRVWGVTEDELYKA